jgi:hypothetical protein
MGLYGGVIADRLRRRPSGDTNHVALAWYQRQQWARLHTLAADEEKLDDRYDDWLASAEQAIADLRELGIVADKCVLDVEAAAEWCRARKRPFDSAARADYVAERMRETHAAGPD